jgi:hypothetical protein
MVFVAYCATRQTTEKSVLSKCIAAQYQVRNSNDTSEFHIAQTKMKKDKRFPSIGR